MTYLDEHEQQVVSECRFQLLCGLPANTCRVNPVACDAAIGESLVKVRCIARRIVGDIDIVSDIVQQVTCEVGQRCLHRRIDERRGNRLSLLSRVAHDTAVTALRKRLRVTQLEDNYDIAGHEDTPLDRLIVREIKEAEPKVFAKICEEIMRLPHRHRIVLCRTLDLNDLSDPEKKHPAWNEQILAHVRSRAWGRLRAAYQTKYPGDRFLF